MRPVESEETLCGKILKGRTFGDGGNDTTDRRDYILRGQVPQEPLDPSPGKATPTPLETARCETALDQGRAGLKKKKKRSPSGRD